MAKQFNGTIALDIRDSVPDWEPYAEPKAPANSPNILYIVIDDTGFGAWEMFGGKIKMPNLARIAKKGLIYTNFHTTALCSPTRSSLLNGRNATSNGMSCIEEVTAGFPGNNGRIPFENAMIPAVLSERGWSTFALGKWHLVPEEEANMASTKRHWPLGRGFERYYGFLGGETDQWYPDLVYDNHLIEPPYGPNMADTENGYHLSKDLVDKAVAFIQDQ
jgi:arylsulfatase